MYPAALMGRLKDKLIKSDKKSNPEPGESFRDVSIERSHEVSGPSSTMRAGTYTADSSVETVAAIPGEDDERNSQHVSNSFEVYGEVAEVSGDLLGRGIVYSFPVRRSGSSELINMKVRGQLTPHPMRNNIVRVSHGKSA